MGLRTRVAASYVLVTVGAVLVMEALLIGIFAPPLIGAKVDERAQINSAYGDALSLAAKMAAGSQPTIPVSNAPCTESGRAGPIMLLLAQDRRILQSSYPACYPVGSLAPAPPGDPDRGGGKSANGSIVWATAPVSGNVLYAQRPLTTSASSLADAQPLITPGLVVLAAAVPVGLLCGYLSMRRPVRQLRRLSATTEALANGDLSQRIPVQGRDELSILERSVNRMAEQLTLAIDAERDLAAAHARTLERAQIARELHDSVSQELFSVRLLASGLQRALPAESILHPQLESMAASAEQASRHMRALLLHLRPPDQPETSLPAALRQLAEAYSSRLGIAVEANVEEETLTPPQEEALVRIVQEAVANAARHARAQNIAIGFRGGTLTVTDDGTGFDAGAPTAGLGLVLMRERAAEVGATFDIAAEPAGGTTIMVVLP
jgi:signal transduction histidine kinase